jgi:hypothetical protein
MFFKCRPLVLRPSVQCVLQLVCGIGCRNEPLSGDNTVGQSLDTTLLAFGITDPDVRMHTYEAIRSASEAILTAIFACEKMMSIEERG